MLHSPPTYCKSCIIAVQALTPLTIGRSSARASLLGALWGFGHSTGQLILGILLVVRTIPSGHCCWASHGSCQPSTQHLGQRHFYGTAVLALAAA